MDATYNEVRLVCAMTALENLIDSNLDNAEAFIQEPRDFDRARRILRRVIEACLTKWSSERAKDAKVELDEKLADLNRRSLLRKIDALAGRRRVPLDGISRESLQAAVRARNRVVHRGQYYEDVKPDDADLWTHVSVVREIVIRFLLTAIGYRGDYISYVGRPRDATFPPG